MANDNTNYGVPIGSGRVRLPSRLSVANFAASVLAVLTGAPVKFQSLTTVQREALTLGAGGKGSVVFDDDLDQLVLWDGAAWVNPDGTALA